MKKSIDEAIKFYGENETELKPVIEKTIEFFQALKNGRGVEARELVTRYDSVLNLREKRIALDLEIQNRDNIANAISFLGLVIKLFAKGI